MKAVWKRIETWLAEHAPASAEDLRPPASDAAIRAAEKKLGVKLPRDVVASYRVHDGQAGAAAPLMDEWIPMRLDHVVMFWEMLRDLREGGDFGDNEGEPKGPVKPEWWNPKWIPLFQDEAGNFRCVDLDPAEGGRAGQIIEYWHAAHKREVIAEGIKPLLEAFADDLEAGGYRVEDGAVDGRK